ncbi:MAG: C-terminal domain, partial [Actinomycetota bacterium]|nr:C-terminal domain [Actinomycetota bacterium]
PGAWVLPLEEGTKAIASRAAGDGSPDGATARITGPAESLLLFLWGRLGPEAVTVEGDRALFEDFHSWAK